MVGIFALAWRKKEKLSLSYLIIEYKDEFGDKQELYLQSEENNGYQHFVNIKYNLQKFWKESSELDNAEEIIKKEEEIIIAEKEKEDNNVMIGCLFIVIIVVILFIANLK